MLEHQPRVLGAIGLAIGQQLRVRFGRLENKWIGDLSDDVKADLNTRAGAVSQSLSEASDTLKANSATQKLKPMTESSKPASTPQMQQR